MISIDYILNKFIATIYTFELIILIDVDILYKKIQSY